MTRQELHNKYTELREDIIRAKNKCACTYDAWQAACEELYKLERQCKEIWDKLKEEQDYASHI